MDASQLLLRPCRPLIFFTIKNTVTFPGLVEQWNGQPAAIETPLGRLRRITEHGPRVGARIAAPAERPDMPERSADTVLTTWASELAGSGRPH